MNAINRHQPSTPQTLAQVTPNQRLFLFAMRSWLENKSDKVELSNFLFSIYGIYYVESAFKAFEVLMTTLDSCSRSTFHLHHSKCIKISTDEMSVLRLLSLMKANQFQSADELALEMVTTEGTNYILDATSMLAAALDARSIIFSARENSELALMSVVGSA